MFQTNVLPIIQKGSREEVYFVALAIFSNGGHLEFLT